MIFYVKDGSHVRLWHGCDIRFVFTLPPRDSTLQYKRCVHLWNNFPCIITLVLRSLFISFYLLVKNKFVLQLGSDRCKIKNLHIKPKGILKTLSHIRIFLYFKSVKVRGLIFFQFLKIGVYDEVWWIPFSNDGCV